MCTAVYVGRKCSSNGSWFIARSEDADNVKVLDVRKTPNKSGDFIDHYGLQVPYPKDKMTYLSLRDSNQLNEGAADDTAYEEVGSNQAQVSVSATVSTICSPEVLAIDPLVENGLAEISLATLVLQHAKTAKEAVKFLAKIIDEQGAKESNIVFISDPYEVWYLEILSGHQYIARCLPDDYVGVFANCICLREVDLSSKDYIYSPNLLKIFNHQGLKADIKQLYNPEYGAYNSYRLWAGQKFLNASLKIEPEADYYAFLIKPDRLITKQDVFDLLKIRYENTPYDANIAGNPTKYRPIGIYRQTECHLIEQPYQKAPIIWLALHNSEFSVYLPIASSIISEIPSYYQDHGLEYNEQSMYHLFHRLAELCFNNRQQFANDVKEKLASFQQQVFLNHQVNLQGRLVAQPNSCFKQEADRLLKFMQQLVKQLEEKAINKGGFITYCGIDQANNL